MTEILQSSLPVAPWMAAHTLRLPGTAPIDPTEWLQRDDAYPEQMALRDRLIAERTGDVHAVTDGAGPAAAETLETVLAHLRRDPGYRRDGAAIVRPDGVRVPLDGPPLAVAGRLVQEDLCILEKPAGGDEHVLTAAILCFPSNWTLAEKLGRGMARIHLPVEHYDEGIARRVQRMLDLLRSEAPLMRANLLVYSTGGLFNPRHEFDRHRPEFGETRRIRVERQVLLRLPRTGAIVFSIHTYMVTPEALTLEQRAALDAVRPDALA
jgi:dimethylamine monooxygenase subunit A